MVKLSSKLLANIKQHNIFLNIYIKLFTGILAEISVEISITFVSIFPLVLLICVLNVFT